MERMEVSAEYKFKFDGLDAELKPLDPDLKLRRSPLGALFKWRCFCQRRTLQISRDDIQQAGKHEVDGHARPGVYDMVKPSAELSKSLNDLCSSNVDFIEYIRRKAELEKRRRLHEFWSLGSETSLSVACDLCGRRYGFRLSLEAPVDVERNEPSLLELWEKRGIANSNGNMDLLTSLFNREGVDAEKPEDILRRLADIDQDLKKIDVVSAKLKGVVAEAETLLSSDVALAWLSDLGFSVDDVTKVLRKELENKLNRQLQYIAEAVESEHGGA